MATVQPGQVTAAGAIGPNGGTATVDTATGFMTHPDNYGRKKTNGANSTGIGVETPFGVLGGTIADQRVRPVVDTRNQTNVGAANVADTVAPLVYEP